MSLYAESSYILCIEGGGTKTILEVIDDKGQTIPLIKNKKSMDKIETTGSNINIVGIDGIRLVLHNLFEDVWIGDKELISIISNSRVVAGLSGASLPKNKQMIASLFQEWGISECSIIITSDAELALECLEGQGIILIAGTGSVCFGKNDQKIFRVGGLGRILGDEGSGYQIGLQACKAVLAEEYGWGIPTSLTPVLREFFQVAELKGLISQINMGEMPPSKIASLSHMVFQQAREGDFVANEIVNHAAFELGELLTAMLKISNLSDCEVHLWGGIFKSFYSDAFVQKIVEHGKFSQQKLQITNSSQENVARVFASKFLLFEK